MSTTQATFQTNHFDRLDLPERLNGMVAPFAVWEYVADLQRRIARLERELEEARRV